MWSMMPLLIRIVVGLTFTVSASAVLLFFVLYPVGLWVVSRFTPRRRPLPSAARPHVTILVVVRNAERLIEEKLVNCLAQRYPEDKLDVVVYSDGSTDDTNRIVRGFEGPRLRFHASVEHHGKIAAMNAAMSHCRGEIVLFSDADALLDPDVLDKLIPHFEDESVGGVCGRRVISRDRTGLTAAQQSYIGFDSAIKAMESRIGSMTSNDGKLYAIRRELFHPIPPAVTDDLYVALDVVRQKRRFVFEPDALARIPVPARGPAHEVSRRRRIVSQSLRGIYLLKTTLNPLAHGWFSVALAVNKVLRRLLPVCLAGLFLSTAALGTVSLWAVLLWSAQAAFYAAGWSFRLLGHRDSPGRLGRATSRIWFFMLGQWGTLLGLIDFLTGRSVVKWDPVKTDAKAY